MKLIGAAFPRTGTMSVKIALESIGFGSCYHMHNIFGNDEHIRVWMNASLGKYPDWKKMFSNYVCTLDAPSCLYWKEISDAFPEAKILLLKRDPVKWYDSISNTIYKLITTQNIDDDPALIMVKELFFEKYFNNNFEDKEYAIKIYQQYCNDVQESVKQNNLLIYCVEEGWKPLCDFLDLDIPKTPFPKSNTRDSFNNRSGLS